MFLCTSISKLLLIPTLRGLLRVWEALSLKLNWLVTFGSFLSVLEATLSGLSSSPASSTSPPSSTGVAYGKPTQGSFVTQITLSTTWPWPMQQNIFLPGFQVFPHQVLLQHQLLQFLDTLETSNHKMRAELISKNIDFIFNARHILNFMAHLEFHGTCWKWHLVVPHMYYTRGKEPVCKNVQKPLWIWTILNLNNKHKHCCAL